MNFQNHCLLSFVITASVLGFYNSQAFAACSADCRELGFTMSESTCASPIIHCPFDTSKVYCPGKECPTDYAHCPGTTISQYYDSFTKKIVDGRYDYNGIICMKCYSGDGCPYGTDLSSSKCNKCTGVYEHCMDTCSAKSGDAQTFCWQFCLEDCPYRCGQEECYFQTPASVGRCLNGGSLSLRMNGKNYGTGYDYNSIPYQDYQYGLCATCSAFSGNINSSILSSCSRPGSANRK